MDVKTLCLGVLSLGDASGYEIKKVFEDAFSHFYVAGYGSIYPALAELIGEGMVTCTDVEQEKRPAKKVYHLTDAGLAQFRQALADTYPAHRVRSDFMVQMVFSHLLGPAQLGEILDRREADIQSQLAHIEHCEADEAGLSPGVAFTTGFARVVLGASLDYIRSNRQSLLQAIQEKDSPE